uniref:Uncharacterized protein n=1 Tax=Picea glauca TaxID=3330 RepID=A0A117NHU4_PICGL|nr:hypothetical protein ABT39_MTgene4211 [Picea glauca]
MHSSLAFHPLRLRVLLYHRTSTFFTHGPKGSRDHTSTFLPARN